jgi:5-methylcytosine-specific restriction endonuclease McrA
MTRREYCSRPGRSSKWCPKAKRLAIYIRDGFSCAYCGTDLRDAAPYQISLDHLIPREAGGTHEATNLVTACFRCNSARQSKPWHRFATAGAVRRIKQLRRRVPNLDLARSILRGEVAVTETLKTRLAETARR